MSSILSGLQCRKTCFVSKSTVYNCLEQQRNNLDEYDQGVYNGKDDFKIDPEMTEFDDEGVKQVKPSCRTGCFSKIDEEDQTIV